MTDAALYRLMTWLSPAYPIGAFSYSHGLERLVEDGDISDAESLESWLIDIMARGGGRNDLIFLAHASRATRDGDDARLRDVAELAAAFAPSRERHLESAAQGRAFVTATGASWPNAGLDRLAACWDGPVALPIAVGCAAAAHGIVIRAAALGYGHAFLSNLVSAGVRLIPLGQSDGQQVIANLEGVVSETVDAAIEGPLDALGGITVLADIASMRHETQYTRLFRS